MSTIEKSRAVIVMGVSGSGKTTVGQELAERLGWAFYDADNFHPKENVAKMSSGQPLTDKDREPWLEALNGLIAENLREENITCFGLLGSKRKISPALGERSRTANSTCLSRG